MQPTAAASVHAHLVVVICGLSTLEVRGGAAEGAKKIGAQKSSAQHIRKA
jgi:hypothetical protein